MPGQGLLGFVPVRNFKIYRSEFPAIFRFNGKLFQEHYNIDTMVDEWMEIDEAEAMRWLAAQLPETRKDEKLKPQEMPDAVRLRQQEDNI